MRPLSMTIKIEKVANALDILSLLEFWLLMAVLNFPLLLPLEVFVNRCDSELSVIELVVLFLAVRLFFISESSFDTDIDWDDSL